MRRRYGLRFVVVVDDVIRLCLFPFAMLLIVQMRFWNGCTHCLFVAFLHMCCVWWLLAFAVPLQCGEWLPNVFKIANHQLVFQINALCFCVFCFAELTN